MDQQPNAALVILAGGSGSRMTKQATRSSDPPKATSDNKVYLPLGARNILEYSLATAAQCGRLNSIVLVIRRGDESQADELLESLNLATTVQVVPGGSTRQESEYAGLISLRDKIINELIQVVAIHDGARPFMSLELLERTIAVAHDVGGAIPGLSLGENLYQIDGNGLEALPTAELRRVQTPQAFRAGPLLDAYDQAATTGFQGVDTAETVERFTDLPVSVVPGDDQNIKVTFADDMALAEQYAATWGSQHPT